MKHMSSDEDPFCSNNITAQAIQVYALLQRQAHRHRYTENQSHPTSYPGVVMHFVPTNSVKQQHALNI